MCVCGRVELCFWYRISRFWGFNLAFVGVWFFGCLDGVSGFRGWVVFFSGVGVDVGFCVGVLCLEGSGW